MLEVHAPVIEGHVSAVVQPIAAIQIARMALPVLGYHLEVEGQVAVAEDEAVIGFMVEY